MIVIDCLVRRKLGRGHKGQYWCEGARHGSISQKPRQMIRISYQYVLIVRTKNEIVDKYTVVCRSVLCEKGRANSKRRSAGRAHVNTW